eukprot:TRINITY_DN45494_c0_g1_i1.p1 TRINITY_DN45494_c0_g1~~TRINITY_DN45494_c0_g1_i1.p1  ORF type:complete len:193 (+),score=67.68 TRINITY_DN45494_c0_g1_i1:142-720(+)
MSKRAEANRLSVSDSLKTHDVWQKTVGHDPYAGEDEAEQLGIPEVGEINQSAKGLFRLAQLTGHSSTLAPGACKRCGQVGHLYFQCRNGLSFKEKPMVQADEEEDEDDPDSDAVAAESEDDDSSDSSDSDDSDESDDSSDASSSESSSSDKKKKKKGKKRKKPAKKEKKTKKKKKDSKKTKKDKGKKKKQKK